jgi:uncharacterized membrane protein
MFYCVQTCSKLYSHPWQSLITFSPDFIGFNMSLDKITKLGRYFLAVPMVVFGIQHFLYAEFVVHLVPTWIPGRLFWTYFAGAALFVSGLGIIINVLSRLAATLLGLMICTWVIILHIPRVFQFPGDSEFINVFDAVCMLSGAFLLAQSLPGKALEKISARGARLSPYLIAASLVIFGIENVIHGKLIFIVGAPAYDVPGQAFWVNITSVIFIAAALSIFFAKRVATVTALLGAYIFLIVVIFYSPLLWANIYDGHAWATLLKGVAMTGSSFILSKESSKEKTIVLHERIPV